MYLDDAEQEDNEEERNAEDLGRHSVRSIHPSEDLGVDWTTDGVCRWLTALNPAYSKYEEKFRELEVDGKLSGASSFIDRVIFVTHLGRVKDWLWVAHKASSECVKTDLLALCALCALCALVAWIVLTLVALCYWPFATWHDNYMRHVQ